MNDPKFQQHGGAHATEHPPHGPRWKRLNHNRFLGGRVLHRAGLVIYVTTGNLSVMPGKNAQPPIPALAP